MWTRKGEGGKPNVHITTWILFSKITQKVGGGKKCPKNGPHMVYGWSLGLRRTILKLLNVFQRNSFCMPNFSKPIKNHKDWQFSKKFLIYLHANMFSISYKFVWEKNALILDFRIMEQWCIKHLNSKAKSGECAFSQ